MKISFTLILILITYLSACGSGIHDKMDSTKYGKGSANLLSPQAKLRKLSLHLRGMPPTLDEYESLQSSIEKKQSNDFFKEKIVAYLKSPQHFGKMMDRLDELFGVRISPLPAEKFYLEFPDKMKNVNRNLNSMDLIFRKVIKENLDWNYIFTAKEYQILNPPVPVYSWPSDLGFYNVIRPDLPPSSDGTIRVPPKEQDNNAEHVLLPLIFAANDERIAGAITTSRFFSRYNTTLLNKNRKRAAAIFRILLCDNMKPLIPSDEDISDIVNKSFPTNFAPVHAMSDEIKHGTQQSCRICHQKLDPMGETFRTVGNVIGAEASPGALVYPTAKGDIANFPASGIGQITQVATEQIEYKQCQVKHFWDWFIGKDVLLTQDRLNILTQEFERLERKPNDFIQYLVQQQEFQEDRAGTFSRDVTFLQVVPILKQCTSCHAGGTTKSIPSFEKIPFGNRPETHKLWLKLIVDTLDLNHDGAHPSMPPRNSGWTLKPEEVEDFHNWISQGAQDENGNKTTDDILINKSFKPKTSVKTGVFGYSGLRYQASSDILRMLEQKFPNAWNNGQLCAGNMDLKAVGYVNPATQEPFLKGPSLSFVKWFTNCLLATSNAEFKSIKSKNLTYDKYLGKSVLKKTKSTPMEALRRNADTFSWSNIPPEIQVGIVTHLIEDAIGQKVAGRENEILQKCFRAIDSMSSPMATDVIKKVLLVTMLQDEFLTY